MNIYTKTGDKGTTSLFGGSRVDKCDLRVDAYGTIDELISFIGLAYAELPDEEEKDILNKIQKELFMLGAELASDEKGLELLKDKIQLEHIEYLEKLIDKYMGMAGPLTAFVIPGKNKPSATLHVARTVARRGERIMTALNEVQPLREEIKKYINRLSDTLFALARYYEENMKKLNDVKELSLEIVKEMAKAAEAKATEMNVPVIFAAVDAGANLMLMHRMEDAFLTSIDIAINKAYTAACLKQGSHEIAECVQPGQSLYGLQLTNNCRIVPFGGGFPIIVDGKVVGAVGVSGGTVEEDMAIAQAAVDCFNNK